MTHDSIEEFSTEEFDRTFKTNVYAMFWLCKYALPRMQPGSVIINTASIQSFDPSPQPARICLNKGRDRELHERPVEDGGQSRACGSMRWRPGPSGPRLFPSTMPKEKVEQFGKDTSFERAAQPRELAPLYVFLACNESNYVTGEVYGATGGQTPY